MRRLSPIGGTISGGAGEYRYSQPTRSNGGIAFFWRMSTSELLYISNSTNLMPVRVWKERKDHHLMRICL